MKEQNRTCDDKDITIDHSVVVSLSVCQCGRMSIPLLSIVVVSVSFVCVYVYDLFVYVLKWCLCQCASCLLFLVTTHQHIPTHTNTHSTQSIQMWHTTTRGDQKGRISKSQCLYKRSVCCMVCICANMYMYAILCVCSCRSLCQCVTSVYLFL